MAARYATSLGSTNALLSGSTVGIGNRITIGNNTAGLTTLADLNDATKMYGATTSSHAVGIGDKLTINGGSRYAVAIGADIVINQNSPDSFAFGRAATIGTTTQSAEGGIAIGAVSKALNTKATAIGSGNLASGAYSTAIGSGGATATQATADGALALGGNATAGAQATNTDAIAIGGETKATGLNSIAIGKGAKQAGSSTMDANNIAFGTNSQNGNTYSGKTEGFEGSQVALGTNTKTSTDGQIAIGYAAQAGAQNHSIAIGTKTSNGSNGNSDISIGRNAMTYGDSSVALSSSAEVWG